MERRKNLCTANAVSFSAKSSYEDVSGRPTKIEAQKNKCRVEEYTEIFGGSRGCSIPILEVPELDKVDVSNDYQRSSVDYSKIFGDFGGENSSSSRAELFGDGARREKTSFCKERSPPQTGSPLQGSDCFSCLEDNQVLPSQASNQSFGGINPFNMSCHKTSQRSKDCLDGTKHKAQLHAVPGFARSIDETAPPQKTEGDKIVSSVKSDIPHNRNFSETFEEKHGRKTTTDVPNKESPEGMVKPNSGSSWRSDSNNLWNGRNVNLISHPSKVPSVPLGNSCDNKGHFKRSTISDLTHENETSKGAGSDCSPPFFDEEVDVNSVATASAAALKKAVEEAKEIIRIAKEIMKRKTDRLQTKLKPSFNCTLKAEDRRGSRTPHSANRIKENTEGPGERVEAVSQVFAAMGKKIAFRSDLLNPDLKNSEKLLATRKVVVEKDKENPDLVEEHDRETWFSELVNRGKRITEVLAFRQKDGKNNGMKLDDNQNFRPRVKAASKNLKQEQDNLNKLKEVEETCHRQGMERIRNADKIVPKMEVNVAKLESVRVVREHEEMEKFKIARGDRETMEKQKDLYEQQECEKNLEESQKTTDDDKFESQKLMEDNNRLNKSKKLVKKEKKRQEASAKEQIEMGIESIHQKEDNESRERDICKEEVEKIPKEVSQFVENGTMLDEFFGGASNEKRLGVDQRLKTDENRPADVDRGEQSKKISEEGRHEWEEKYSRPKGDGGHVDAKSMQKESDKRKENEKVEVKENAIFEVNFDSVCDEGKHAVTENICECQEACRDEATSEKIETRQEIISRKENGKILGAIETTCEFKLVEKEAEAVKVAYKLKKKAVFVTAGLFPSALEANEIKNTMKDASGVIPSYDNAPVKGEVMPNAVYGMNFDSVFVAGKHESSKHVRDCQDGRRIEVTNNVVEEREVSVAGEENEKMLGIIEAFCDFEEVEKDAGVSEEAYNLKKKVFETAGLVQGPTKGSEIKHNAKDVSEGRPYDDDAPNFDWNGMNRGQKLVEQHDKEFHLGFSHKYGENEKDVKEDEIACDKEDQEKNYEAAHEKRQWVQKDQDVEASQLLGVAERKQKAKAIYEEINTSQKMEKEFSKSFVMRGKETKEKEQTQVERKEQLSRTGEINIRERAEKDKTPRRHWEKDRTSVERAIREAQLPVVSERKEKAMKIHDEIKTSQKREEKNVNKSFVMENKESSKTVQKEVDEKANPAEIDEANKKEREKRQRRHWDKDRVAVDRAICEARQRAFSEARERAKRASVERAAADIQQRVVAEAREKFQKASTSTKSTDNTTLMEAKRRSELAALEIVTAKARERALEKTLSQRTTSAAKAESERLLAEKFSCAYGDNGMRQSFSSDDPLRFDGTVNESAQRRKARLERQQRIMERAAKALAEKNMRDVLAQKEQAERNRLSESLDANVKRWSRGKEGNLRALLSTLHYILGPDSGWQPISLTDLLATNPVKKAYRKATLCVHPDKLQQRRASIQQKYICEKVFDLLKAAWNRFNSEDR